MGLTSEMAYTKLFNKILASSIWNEDDKTRLVWITMLAMQNERHIVEGSVGGIATLARVSHQDAQNAIKKLEDPDPDDSSKVEEGRRIKSLEHGGWLIVNGEAYRKAKDEDERRAYLANYMRAWRAKRSVNKSVNKSKASLTAVNTIEQNRIEQNKEESHVEKGGEGGKGEDFCLNGSDEPNSGRPTRKPVLLTMKAIRELSENPAYEGIDLDKEAWKFKQWCETNNRTQSVKRFVNWINKIV